MRAQSHAGRRSGLQGILLMRRQRGRASISQPWCFSDVNTLLLLFELLVDLCASLFWRIKLVHELGTYMTF